MAYNGFLACVIVAGIYRTVTVNRRILYVQAVPALFVLVAVLIAFPLSKG